MRLTPLLFASALMIATLMTGGCSNENRESPTTEDLQNMTNELISGDMVAATEELEGKDEDDEEESKTWRRTGRATNHIRLSIGDYDTLPLHGMQMQVKVDGFKARVLMDAWFMNDAGGVYEGTFKMRLPNGASPYYFAFGESVLLDQGQPDNVSFMKWQADESMDLTPERIFERRQPHWSQPKEARVVPKEKAALAYTSTAKQRIDPALMEWAGPDVFNCRVFPLNPDKLHRIVIGYDVDLTEVGSEWAYLLDLPQYEVPTLVSVDVATGSGKAPTFAPEVDVESFDQRHRVTLENPDFDLLEVRMPTADLMLTDSQYFAGRHTFLPPLSTIQGNAPSQGVFLLDVSLSSSPDKLNIWLDLMEATLNESRSTLKQFKVIAFNIEAFAWQDQLVANNEQNVAAMRQWANQLTLEGATDIDLALRQGAAASDGETALFLMSDGAGTWGEDQAWALSSALPATHTVYAYQTGLSGTNVALLNHLTRESGGSLMTVTGPTSIASAAKAWQNSPWKLEKIEVDGAEDVLIAGRPQYLYSGQPLLLTGRSDQDELDLSLVLSLDGKQRKIKISFNEHLSSPLAGRSYGQVATAQLESFQHLTEDQSIAYATHFDVPGQTCSFVMLESEADYASFNIRDEDQTFVVNNSPVSESVMKALSSVTEELKDARTAFVRWTERLENQPGFTFERSPRLNKLLELLPSESFRIESELLNGTETRQSANLDESYLNTLAKAELDYDAIESEADERLRTASRDDALKAWSSLVEKSPGDGVLLRDVAFQAMAMDYTGQACYLLRKAARQRPWEPQTYHALGLALSDQGNTGLAAAYFEIALNGQWNERFGEFRTIVALDYVRMLRQTVSGELPALPSGYADERLKDLNTELNLKDADVVVTISWNTDNTDIDLHVVEPDGTEVYYRNPTSSNGGRLTKDVTQGYGPEMYVMEDAPGGRYEIKANFYGSDASRTSARTRIICTTYRNWGTAQETMTRKTIKLSRAEEMRELGSLSI